MKYFLFGLVFSFLSYVPVNAQKNQAIQTPPQQMVGDLHGTMFDHLVTSHEKKRYTKIEEDRERQQKEKLKTVVDDFTE